VGGNATLPPTRPVRVTEWRFSAGARPPLARNWCSEDHESTSWNVDAPFATRVTTFVNRLRVKNDGVNRCVHDSPAAHTVGRS
jgi:hypothetical protein